MTVSLTAPISETDYRSMPNVLKLPADITGDAITTLLNEAWDHITNWCQQPLSKTSTTETIRFKSKFANLQPDGYLHLLPRFKPLISVTSLAWSVGISANGWTATTNFDALIAPENEIIVYDAPFTRADFGFIQAVYYSGLDPIPDRLKMLCAFVASHLFSGSMFPSQGGSSILPSWLPKEMKDIIDRHKRIV